MPAGKQSDATRRLVALLHVLSRHPAGIDADAVLARLGSFSGAEKTQRDQLARDIRHLREQGHRIENLGPTGANARYKLTPGDDRIRASFSREQRHQLVRASMLAGTTMPPGLAEESAAADDGAPGLVAAAATSAGGPDIGTLLHAVTRRCIVRFRYSGRERVVHPMAIGPQQRGWVLAGLEEESDQVKTFTAHKMSDLRLDAPGTASPPSVAVSVDPLSWEVDPASTARLLVATRFVPDVERLLHQPTATVAVDTAEGGEDSVEMVYRVTNRRIFLSRMFELGMRVRLTGDETMRSEAAALLRSVMEA